MRKVEYWVAEDGEEFDTEKECYDYEHKDDKLANAITLFKNEDDLLERTSIFKNDLELAHGFYVPTDEIAEELMDFFNYNGMENPWDKWNGLPVQAGHYTWEDDGWHCLEEEVEILRNRLEYFYKIRNTIV